MLTKICVKHDRKLHYRKTPFLRNTFKLKPIRPSCKKKLQFYTPFLILIDSLFLLGETNRYLTSTHKNLFRSSNRNLFFHPLYFWHHFSLEIFYEEDNHVQVSPEFKVNQLLRMIVLSADSLSTWSPEAFDLPLTFQKARRSCKRLLDYRENTKCYKRLLLVKNDSRSNQSINESILFSLLLVTC